MKIKNKTKLWKLVLFLLEIIIFGLCYGLIYQLALKVDFFRRGMFREPARYNFEIMATFATFVIMYFVIFPLLRKIYAGWKLRDFGIRFDNIKESLCFSLVIFFASLTISNIGFLIFPNLPQQIIDVYRIQNSADIYIFVFFVSPIVAGIGEEIYFRSYLQGALSKIDPSWAPIFAALVFACLHYFQGIIPLIAFHIPGAIIVAAVYSRTKSIFAVIPSHIAYDMIVFAEVYHCSQNPQYHFYITVPILIIAICGLIFVRSYIFQIIEELKFIGKGLKKNPKIALFAAVIFIGGFYSAKYFALLDYQAAYRYSILHLGVIVVILMGLNYGFTKKLK